ELGEKLRTENEKEEIESITLIGLCTDICVISNALLIKAFLPETKIKVDAACCAGVTPDSHKTALNAMKMCQIEIENEG
ncbi:MAG: isochorismatase family protein, partial [Clostridia bacterium]|nr:isochorismatase family protein [Clostridia bacterium]